MRDRSTPVAVLAVSDHATPGAADAAAENAEVATANADMLSQLIQGYSADFCFAPACNTAALDMYQGLYYRLSYQKFLSSIASSRKNCMVPTIQGM